MIDNVSIVAEPKTQCRDIGLLSDVLGRMCLYAPLLLGCITDEISTVEEPETQCRDNGLLRPTCWVRCVYMGHSGNMNC